MIYTLITKTVLSVKPSSLHVLFGNMAQVPKDTFPSHWVIHLFGRYLILEVVVKSIV